MTSRERLQAARGAMRPPSAPPTGSKRKERDFEQNAGDETNINVVVRCRGRSEREVRENSGVVVYSQGVKSNNVELSMGPNAMSKKTYHFDRVFSPAADQAIIFEDVVAPILNEMLAGYNCTIFAYGQTGTGKTYTMTGDMTDTLGLLSDNAGIIPRVLYSLFQKLEADGAECSVKCSFIELYNEELRDLLSADDSVKLKIYDDSARKSHSSTVVQGMEETHIKSASAGIKLLQQGSHRRQVAATKCNDLSSRSHTVFTITTYTKKAGDSSEDFICSGKLNLVDLAGSENIQRSGAENKRAAEAGLINKSLLTLGRVINALVDKSQHIPYRESKLTRLLQDSLGGRTKTCIIATVSQAKSNLEETISTLDYAFRAKNIRNKPQVNSMISKKTLLKEFTAEIEKLKSELIATRQRNGVYLTNEQYEEIMVESESRRILSEEQSARIETMEASLRNKVQELFNLTNNFTILKKDNEGTRAMLESTKDILVKTDIVLKDAEKNLAEETLLRKAHEETEIKLRGIGTNLITTVEESVSDIEALNAKLRRRSRLHKQNQESWSATAEQARNVSSTIDRRIENLEQDFSAGLVMLSMRVQAFVAEEVEKMTEEKNIIDHGFEDLTKNVEDAVQKSSNTRDEMDGVLEGIKDLREEVKSKVGEGLHGLSDAAARISGEVISELDQFHTQLHTSYSGLGRDLKQMFDDMTEELTTQRSEATRLRAALHEANLKIMQSTILASAQIESRLESERKVAESEEQRLFDQIARLVAANQSRRDGRLAQAVTDIKCTMLTSAQELEKADAAFGNGMDGWHDQDLELVERFNSSKETLKSRMKHDWTAIEARNAAIQSSTKVIHQETVQIVQAQLEAMSSQMAALDDFVMHARQQNADDHDGHVTSLGTMASDIKTTFDQLNLLLDKPAAKVLQTECQARIDGLLETIMPLGTDVRQPLQDLTSHFAGTALADYIPTGETPQRKVWQYPTELPVTKISTTPPSNPPVRGLATQTPSRTRSPRKSPKKLASPRKVVREIYVDSPIAVPPVGSATTTNLRHLELGKDGSRPPIAGSTRSLKEVDINIKSANHTIMLPVTPSDDSGKQMSNVERVAKSDKTASQIPPPKSARNGQLKSFSASVGVGSVTHEDGKEKDGKENFLPSKSMQLPSFPGRRLRSGHVSPQA